MLDELAALDESEDVNDDVEVVDGGAEEVVGRGLEGCVEVDDDEDESDDDVEDVDDVVGADEEAVDRAGGEVEEEDDDVEVTTGGGRTRGPHGSEDIRSLAT